MPTTAGLWGFGYFLHTAWVTVSHGWLEREKKVLWIIIIIGNYIMIIISTQIDTNNKKKQMNSYDNFISIFPNKMKDPLKVTFSISWNAF